jgi:hypothetical protein
MDEAVLRGTLEYALLTDMEMVEGPEAWARYYDPIDSWFG